LDVQFISLWISFNACYAVEINELTSKSERLKFKTFIDKKIIHDSENRFYNLLRQNFSGRDIFNWVFVPGRTSNEFPAFANTQSL